MLINLQLHEEIFCQEGRLLRLIARNRELYLENQNFKNNNPCAVERFSVGKVGSDEGEIAHDREFVRVAVFGIVILNALFVGLYLVKTYTGS